MYFLRLLLILSALLFILFQRVDVRVTKRERLTVKISFNILAFVLMDDGERNRYLGNMPKLFKGFKGKFRSIRYLLAKSRVTFGNTHADTNEGTPFVDISFHFSLLRLIISALILLYYKVKAKVKRVI